jgi:lipoyl(octanoyl) transferase
MINWNLITSGANTGRYNMEFDINLARNCKEDEAFLRIYTWEPFCISLGANQNIDEINLELAGKENIDCVHRPTGGRAILHAEEVTYSVVLPYSASYSAKDIYTSISLALLEGLKLYSPVLAKAELEGLQPNFPNLLKSPSGMLCFASTAKSEIKFKGKKLIGSAQRKMEKIVLQHGSILCGTFHRKLPGYLVCDDSTRKKLEKELIEKTIEIDTIINEKTDSEKLTDCLIAGFESFLNVKFKNSISV